MIGCAVILKQVFSDFCVLFFEIESLFHGSDFLLEMGQFADMVLFVLCEDLLVDLGV
jgi:hypothetical protein